MLESLTPEQEELMLKVRDYWKDLLFSCKHSINKEKATEFVTFIYELSSLGKPEIIFVDSPMACQKKVNEMKGNEKETFEEFSYYGNISDYGWVSFYDFFTQIGILNDEKFNKYRDLLASCGVYDMIQLKSHCIVSDMPDRIERDDQGRLHCEEQSAIHFKDGYEQYYWHGVYVPKNWIMNKEDLTKDTFLTEENAEKRRCLQEIIGNERLIEMLGVVLIDEDFETSKNNENAEPIKLPVKLFRTKEKDSLIDEHIFFLNVIDPSTGRAYYLCVPECKNVWEGKSWTLSHKKPEIRHGDVWLRAVDEDFEKPVYES
jgi:hypothetical protein